MRRRGRASRSGRSRSSDQLPGAHVVDDDPERRRSGCRERRAHRRSSSAEVPVALGSNLGDRASHGPAEVDGTAFGESGGELVAFNLAAERLEHDVAKRATAPPRVSANLPVEGCGNVLHLQIRHGTFAQPTRPPVCRRNSYVPQARSTTADSASTASVSGSSRVHPWRTRMRMLAIAYESGFRRAIGAIQAGIASIGTKALEMKRMGSEANPVIAKNVPCPGTAYASARKAAVTASVRSATVSMRTRKPAGPAASRTPIANATASSRTTCPASRTVW